GSRRVARGTSARCGSTWPAMPPGAAPVRSSAFGARRSSSSPSRARSGPSTTPRDGRPSVSRTSSRARSAITWSPSNRRASTSAPTRSSEDRATVTGAGGDAPLRRRRRPRVAAFALILLAVTGVPGARGRAESQRFVAGGGVPGGPGVVGAGAAAGGAVWVELVEPEASRRVEGSAAAERDFTVALTLDGLHPGTRHAYRVRWRDVERTGSFVTAPAPDTPAPVRLLWSGDLGGGGHCRSPVDGYPVFRPMAARQPGLFVFVGDTLSSAPPGRGPPHLPA